MNNDTPSLTPLRFIHALRKPLLFDDTTSLPLPVLMLTALYIATFDFLHRRLGNMNCTEDVQSDLTRPD